MSAVKGILTAYYSKPDSAGNRYWAFAYTDAETGDTVRGTTTGGEVNINAIRMELNGGHWPPPQQYVCATIGMAIREWGRMTKEWPHAGSQPAELAEFIRRGLALCAAKRQTDESKSNT